MFKLQAELRLNTWKKFREEISVLNLDNAVQKTLDFWGKCPFTPFYLNCKDPTTWPDPWTLLNENCYCDLAKVLGIIYTLHLCDHGKNLNPELRIYVNNQTRHTYHVAYLCNGKYVLNLIEGEIVNKEHINQELKLKHCYTAADLKLEQY